MQASSGLGVLFKSAALGGLAGVFAARGMDFGALATAFTAWASANIGMLGGAALNYYTYEGSDSQAIHEAEDREAAQALIDRDL